MSFDIVLLILRIASALALYLFLLVIFVYIRRDVQLAAEQISAGASALGRLTVVDCDEDIRLEIGQEFVLRTYTTLGRGPTNTIILPDTFASTEHAQISLRNGQWWLDDRQSRNGTTINDLPITKPVVLTSEDVIGVGRVKLKIEIY